MGCDLLQSVAGYDPLAEPPEALPLMLGVMLLLLFSFVACCLLVVFAVGCWLVGFAVGCWLLLVG